MRIAAHYLGMTTESASVTSDSPVKTKKRHHVWLWTFLVVQAIFIIWIIAGAASASATNCGTLSKDACAAATEVGTGIGVALIVGLWIGVDVVLLLIKLVVQLTRRGTPRTA